MRYLSWISLLGALASCGGAPVATPEPPVVQSALSQAKLGVFMRENVNLHFSRLSFMIFHAEEVEESEEEVAPGDSDDKRVDGGSSPAQERALELGRASIKLAEAAKRLRAFSSISAPSEEGRAVFDTYVENLVRETDGLAGFIAAGDLEATALTLERITGTCNSCHHFYRLKDVAR